MNITELIVELLQKGQRVELPEIGTFDSVTQAPRHDTASGTYYPATRNIVFRPGTSGDNSMVKIIAERDCVNEDVARQMWVNYTDALNEKIQRTGEHQFGPLGTLTKAGSGFAFEMSEGVVIEAGGSTEKPIEGVKTYDHSGSADPFAQFEEEPVGTVVQKPEPVRAPEPEPEPGAVPEPEPKPEAELEPALAEKEEVVAEEVKAEEVVDEAWQEKLKQVEELPKSKAMLKAETKAEKARIKAEAKAEKERAKLRKRAQKDHDSTQRRMEEDREAEARREAEDRHRAEKELRKAEQKAEEGRLRAEKEAEAALQRAEKKAEEERVKATKRAAALAALAAAGQTAQSAGAEAAPLATNPAAMAQQEAKEELERQVAAKQKEMERAEKEAARQAKEAEKEAARRLKEEKRQAEEAAKEAARQAKAAKKEAAKAAALAAKATEGEEKEEKKSRKGWLWLLLLLLLLLLAGGAYYFLKMKPQSGVASTELAGKHFDAPNVNSLTFNTDMIDYSSREINRNTDMVSRTMAEYIDNFLAEQGYRNARTAMMDHVRQYADQRLGEMMGPRMAAQRFLPYEDYVYQDAEPWLRQRYAYQSRGQVQGELMDEGFMDRMLNRIIDDYGIMPDNAQVPTTAPAQAATLAQPAAQKKAVAPANENPVYVYVEKESKQGFDIVAGFYLNKATAARMAARLHELGCDAYIIEKNEMYYVSMGSAPTRTKAEALYKHIKSWYDGDVVIKEL